MHILFIWLDSEARFQMKELTPKENTSEDLMLWKMSAVKQKTAKEPSEELCEYNEFVDIYGFSLPATGDECCKDFLQSLNLIHSRRAQTWTQQGKYDEYGKP